MIEHNPGEAPSPISPQFHAVEPPTGRYVWLMLALLSSVTIFEGYDVAIFHLCTPDIARTFHLSDFDIGAVASLIKLGGALAFVIVVMADRIGRKPIVSYTVLFYATFILLTALSTGLKSFTLFEACSQLFLSAEFSVATIMISEEFPDRWRGRGVATLNMIGLVGVITAASLYSPVASSRFGWRGMYLIGVAPLIIVAYLRRNLRETRRFVATMLSRGAQPPFFAGLRQGFAEAMRGLSGPYRGRLLMVALLWNSVGVVGAPAVTFFSLYAIRDHHWTRGQVGGAVVIAYVLATFGHILAGYMLDRVGRKATTALFYVAGAFSVLALFQLASHDAMVAAMVAAVFSFQGSRTATATYSAELFPTEIRATSYSLTVQVLGGIAALLTPFTIGALSRSLGGLGNAVAVVSVGPIIGAIIVTLFAPETRGKALEELADPNLS